MATHLNARLGTAESRGIGNRIAMSGRFYLTNGELQRHVCSSNCAMTLLSEYALCFLSVHFQEN